MASKVTTAAVPSMLAGIGAASYALVIGGLSIPVSLFTGVIASFLGSRKQTTIVEADGTTFVFFNDSVVITLPDGTSGMYSLQELADLATASGQIASSGSTATTTDASSGSDDAALIADAVRLGAALLG